MNYKDFYDDLLIEMPTDIEYGEEDGLDIPSENKVWVEFAKTGDFVGKYTIGGNIFHVYKTNKSPSKYDVPEFKTGNVTSMFFLNPEETKILANHSFKEGNSNGKTLIQNTLIWKDRNIKGFMKEWFSKYIVPKYDIIYSDQAITMNGLEFWRWLFLTYVRKGMKMFAYDKNKKTKIELKTPSDLEKYRGSGKINIWFALYTK